MRMLIEKNYYEKLEREQEKWYKEMLNENEKKSEDVLLQEERQRNAEVMEIMKKGEECLQKINKVPSAERMMQFVKLQKAAMEVAYLSDMNIKTDKKDDDTYGYIELSYKISWIVPDSPKVCRKTMAALYENAEQIRTNVKDNRVVQRFDFELAE